ncbi:MAG: 16S rRNA (uracil(1498)-N(3))-methyltransferase [Agromyces sp.]
MAHQYLSREVSTVAPGDTISLHGAEAKHAASVSRIRVGESIRVSNGRGLMAVGTVAAASASEVRIEVEQVDRVPANRPELWLVQALAKGDRDELAVQAATELGVDRIIPWAAARSISRWDAAKAEKGKVRWQTIVDEAAKQSLRPWTPEVAPLHDTTALVGLVSSGEVQLLLCVPGAAMALTDVEVDDRPVVLVVGPEGGMDAAEIDRLLEAGAQSVRLGAEVLRTSTAGPAALAVLASRLGRWSVS